VERAMKVQEVILQNELDVGSKMEGVLHERASKLLACLLII
jgi:hypothetical protein